MTGTLKVKDNTKAKFDKLQFDLKVKEGKKRTQDELENMLIDFFKENYKGDKIKKLE